MKFNKTIALVALVAGGMLASGALQAQTAPTNQPAGIGAGGPRGLRPLSPEKLAKELGLSDDQTTKFKAVLDDGRKQLQELRADTSLSPEDKRAKGKSLREATNGKVKEILTAEQYEKYLKLAPGPRNRPGAGAPPAAGAPAAPPATPAQN